MVFEIVYADNTTRTITGVETKAQAIEVSKELEPKAMIKSILAEPNRQKVSSCESVKKKVRII